MKYETKSIIIGRKKRANKEDQYYPCFIYLFNINDAHKTSEIPTEMLDFDKTQRVFINGLDIKYLLPGNDLIINDLEFVNIEIKDADIYISGKQSK